LWDEQFTWILSLQEIVVPSSRITGTWDTSHIRAVSEPHLGTGSSLNEVDTESGIPPDIVPTNSDFHQEGWSAGVLLADFGG